MHINLRDKMKAHRPTGYDKVAGKQLDARRRDFDAGLKGDGGRKRPTGYTRPGSMKRKAL